MALCAIAKMMTSLHSRCGCLAQRANQKEIFCRKLVLINYYTCRSSPGRTINIYFPLSALIYAHTHTTLARSCSGRARTEREFCESLCFCCQTPVQVKSAAVHNDLPAPHVQIRSHNHMAQKNRACTYYSIMLL
jgi:hypothetical protein